ncbi:hypothetical protein BDN70DRAFT_555748 [Pholiota conissans]|uniref:Uncharacterized protein n=1 Tax=Pholiota conissans TaxID=109636 RepID=A0A9P5YLQ5_9AGAR|nr:hypothetical protein BDN70DRAFT_555748 [Pholiota conissans]
MTCMILTYVLFSSSTVPPHSFSPRMPLTCSLSLQCTDILITSLERIRLPFSLSILAYKTLSSLQYQSRYTIHAGRTCSCNPSSYVPTATPDVVGGYESVNRDRWIEAWRRGYQMLHNLLHALAYPHLFPSDSAFYRHAAWTSEQNGAISARRYNGEASGSQQA